MKPLSQGFPCFIKIFFPFPSLGREMKLGMGVCPEKNCSAWRLNYLKNLSRFDAPGKGFERLMKSFCFLFFRFRFLATKYSIIQPSHPSYAIALLSSNKSKSRFCLCIFIFFLTREHSSTNL